jgi:radical SAM-linked protein
MEIRFRFGRGEELKFIGHLDILRLFERAFKRSGIQVAHSEGFNPRPRIVFAQPMPLGLTSEGEFADVELVGQIDTADFKQRINSSLPAGINVIEAKVKTGRSNLMGIIDAARYRIWFEAPDMLDIKYAVNSVLNSGEINVVKKTKSGEKEVNIRPFIYELSGEKDGRTGFFDVILGAGQDNNIRPELFLEGISKASNIPFSMRRMHRVMLYCSKKKAVPDLMPAENIWITPMDDLLL